MNTRRRRSEASSLNTDVGAGAKTRGSPIGEGTQGNMANFQQLGNSQDDILRRRLMNLGEDVGPITDGTRDVYKKKLARLINGTSSGSTATNSPGRRRSSSPRNLGHFSDDSDAGQTGSVDRRPRRRSTATSTARKKATPERPSIREGFLNSRPQNCVGDCSFEADYSDNEAPLSSTSSFPYYRINNSLLVHRAEETGRGNSYPACTEERGRYQWVSAALVVTVALFFLFLAAAYMGVRYPSQKATTASTKKQFKTDAPYNSTLCEDTRQKLASSEVRSRYLGGARTYEESEKHCIWKENIPKALELSNLLQRRLQEVAGQYECGESPVRNLSSKQCLEFLQERDSTVTDIHYRDVLLLLLENPAWGVVLYDKDGVALSTAPPGPVETLGASVVAKSYLCCLRMAFYSVFNQIVLGGVVLLAIGGIYYAALFYKAYRARQLEQLYGLVEKISQILREHAEKSEGAFMAQVHVRDMLIAPSDRQRLAGLWQRAVAFLEKNESRIRTERQHIEGESYLVWRWLPGGSLQQRPRVWQGRAFENSTGSPSCHGGSSGGGNTPPHFVPATCLKIRNMFDPDVEDEPDWPVQIQNAILEKCEGNSGIVHLRVDTSSKEGCVYMKCLSLESAGLAYRALHGSWFDGNLITVKYLRLERYHERFPEAQFCREPLRPSNALRLSLASPPAKEEDPL